MKAITTHIGAETGPYPSQKQADSRRTPVVAVRDRERSVSRAAEEMRTAVPKVD
jgi:hypothetical protein